MDRYDYIHTIFSYIMIKTEKAMKFLVSFVVFFVLLKFFFKKHYV